MSGAYPHFKSCYTHEELVEHFLLTPAELQLVFTCRGDANRCGIALLLKALVYLGYVPEKLNSIPGEVRSFIAGQLGLLWDFCEQYPRDSRTRKQHIFLIRQHTGWRFLRLRTKKNSSCGCARKQHFKQTPQTVSLITPASGSEIGRWSYRPKGNCSV